MRFKFRVDGIYIGTKITFNVGEGNLQETLARVPKRDIVSIKQIKNDDKPSKAPRKADDFNALLALYGLKPWSEEGKATSDKCEPQQIESAAGSQPSWQPINNGRSTSNVGVQTLTTTCDSIDNTKKSEEGGAKCSVCEHQLRETGTEPQLPSQPINNRRSTSDTSTQTLTTNNDSTDNTKKSESENAVEQHATQMTSSDVRSSSSDSDGVVKSRPKKKEAKQSAKKTKQTEPTLSARKVQFSETAETRNIPLREASVDSRDSESSKDSKTSRIETLSQRDIDDSVRPRRRPRSKRSFYYNQRDEEMAKNATTETVPPVRRSSNTTSTNRSADQKERSGQEAGKLERKHGRSQPKPILKYSDEPESSRQAMSRSRFQGQAAESPVRHDSKHRIAGSASSKSREATFVVGAGRDLRGNHPGFQSFFVRQPGQSPGYQNDSNTAHEQNTSSHSHSVGRKSASNQGSRDKSSKSRKSASSQGSRSESSNSHKSASNQGSRDKSWNSRSSASSQGSHDESSSSRDSASSQGFWGESSNSHRRQRDTTVQW